METKGWTPSQIDEVDVHFYFDLLGYNAKMKDPEEQKKKKWRDAKVVPIDAVF